MIGIFVLGGLLVIPFLWADQANLSYSEARPWSLASCFVFFIAFRRNGTISWGRAVIAIGTIVFFATNYSSTTGKPSFAAGGFLGFIVLLVCGYLGIGIGKIVRSIMK